MDALDALKKPQAHLGLTEALRNTILNAIQILNDIHVLAVDGAGSFTGWAESSLIFIGQC
jgi:hypothetical protein